MRFRVLGPLEVWDGHGWAGVPAAKQRALLAVLLLKANQLVTADRLIEQLWAQRPPAGATNQLQVYISRLRRRLDDRAGRVLVTQSPGYRLVVGAGELDLQRFEELVAGGRRALQDGALETAAGSFGEALGLWRGQALADVPSGLLVDGEAARLEERRLGVEEDLAEVELGRGGHGGLVGQLHALVAAQPLRERRWGQLLVALYRSGRQAEALAAYQELRHRLVEELGVAPGPPLQRLQRQILTADPALELPRTPSKAVGAEPANPSSQSGSVPRQVPADTATFTGREQELAQLAQTLAAVGTSGPVVISAIDGTGGIGKSALAIHAAHQLAERFPDGQLYVNLQGTTAGLAPLGPLDALGRLLRSLGADPAQIPAQVEEAAGLFRTLAAQRRLLMVLDNAATVKQVRPLLPASPTCGVLVTSRQVLAALEGAQVLHLDVLSHEQAVELLGRIAGQPRVAAEPQAAAAVVRLCGYLPLAIQITGARLAARPTWPVGELAKRLANATRRLEELAAGDLAVRASFEVSLHGLQHGLDPVDQAAAAAFGPLGLPDGPDVGVTAAARLLGQPEGTAQVLLERLVDAQLLQTPRPGRYQFHDLVRLAARHHAATTQPEPERLAALERLVGFYTATAWHTLELLRPGDQRLATADPRWTSGGLRFPDAAAALGWLETERANLLAAIGQAAAIAPAVSAKLATELTRALFGFFDVRSYWHDGEQAGRTALQLARRTGDRVAQAQVQNHLGAAKWQLGRAREAVACFQESLTIHQELGDRGGQAASLGNLGVAYDLLGHDDDAIACHHQSLTIARELGYRSGQAVGLGNLGIAYLRVGRHDEAISHLRKSLALFGEVGDRRGQARTQINLGVAYERQGRYDEAIGYLQEALAICREFGDRGGQVESLCSLGVVHGRLGRYEDAISCLYDSLALSRELGDRYWQAVALRDLGDVLLGAGRHQQAGEVWQEALELSEALQVPEADEVRRRLGTLPAEPDGPVPGGV